MGELVTLGVSGCVVKGISQIIAGLINPDSGDIIFNDKSVLNTPTGKRDGNSISDYFHISTCWECGI